MKYVSNVKIGRFTASRQEKPNFRKAEKNCCPFTGWMECYSNFKSKRASVTALRNCSNLLEQHKVHGKIQKESQK